MANKMVYSEVLCIEGIFKVYKKYFQGQLNCILKVVSSLSNGMLQVH